MLLRQETIIFSENQSGNDVLASGNDQDIFPLQNTKDLTSLRDIYGVLFCLTGYNPVSFIEEKKYWNDTIP